MTISKISDNAKKVLEMRYLAKDQDGKIVETIDGMFRRVANTLGAVDGKFSGKKDIEKQKEEFFKLMTQLKFLPNSPTLMNAGRPLGQLSACFVLPIEDSMEGIFDSVKHAALIHKSGGGTGFSFSRLRQQGAAVRSTGGIASGPVSFMKVFNAATEAVKQGGTRRGANMGVLRVDHPDILEFINCKRDNKEITNFNISVGLTEKFMEAVEKQEDYDLVEPSTKRVVGHLSAEKVFDIIVDHAWRNGEPGIIFLDRMNRDNPTPRAGEIESTNPCGEQPLLPYESCNLGSINLVEMLRKTLTSYEFDYRLLEETVEQAVHFLDNVIEANNYPLGEIDKVTKSTRKVGLGIMGWADALLLMSIPYNSKEAVDLAEKVMGFINTVGHITSQKLAKERGAFPLFGESIYKDGKPMRNSTVTTIAPTGTLSIIAGCSSGVEPVFAYVYIRNIMDGTEMIEVNPILKNKLEEVGLATEEVYKRIAEEGTIAHIEEIPEEIRRVFVSSHDISPLDHVRMQGAFQRHTDNAVSKTINFTKEATKGQVREAYKLAYKEGLKGVTIYRDGSREEQVLNIGKVNKASESQSNSNSSLGENEVAGIGTCSLSNGKADCHECETFGLTPNYGKIEPRPRPEITQGFTEKVKIGCGTLYITTNYDENGICEVFTSTGKAGGCPSQSEATARLASVALRSGISINEVYDQLKGIRCPSTIRQQGMNCTSCPDAIARVIMKVSKKIEQEELAKSNQNIEQRKSVEPATAGEIHSCPECGSIVEHEGGCVICRDCGFSKCG